MKGLMVRHRRLVVFSGVVIIFAFFVYGTSVFGIAPNSESEDIGGVEFSEDKKTEAQEVDIVGIVEEGPLSVGMVESDVLEDESVGSFETELSGSEDIIDLTIVAKIGEEGEFKDEIIEQGDILSISIYGSEDMHDPPLRFKVGHGGMIIMPIIGEVYVEGLTESEAQEKLDEMFLDGYLTQPQSVVYILSKQENFRYGTYTVIGEVGRPGIYDIKIEGVNLINALNIAGNVTKNGDRAAVKVYRMEDDVETEITVNLDSDPGFLVFNGDRVEVNDPGTFMLYGEVNRPGKYYIREDMTVTEAILNAGGFTRTASKNGVKIIRDVGEDKPETIKVPVAHIFRTGNREKDQLLKSDDIVIVPESWF